MRYLDIVHPAAKTLADISLSQVSPPLTTRGPRHTHTQTERQTGRHTLSPISPPPPPHHLALERDTHSHTHSLSNLYLFRPLKTKKTTTQDAEVGDGTTSVVLLAAEILKQVKIFVEDGLHPQVQWGVRESVRERERECEREGKCYVGWGGVG